MISLPADSLPAPAEIIDHAEMGKAVYEAVVAAAERVLPTEIGVCSITGIRIFVDPLLPDGVLDFVMRDGSRKRIEVD